MTPAENALQLLLRLHFAAKIFHPSKPALGRKSAIVSLLAVNSFLISMGAQDKSVNLPINELIWALEDLNRGRIQPLLRKTKVKNRPKNSISEESFRLFSAVAMELFMDGGAARGEAARLVAQKLTRLGYKHPTAITIEAKHVEDWRDKIMQTDQDSAEMIQFRHVKDVAIDPFPDEPVAAAKFLLENFTIPFRPQHTR